MEILTLPMEAPCHLNHPRDTGRILSLAVLSLLLFPLFSLHIHLQPLTTTYFISH